MNTNDYNFTVKTHSDALYAFVMSHRVGQAEAEDIVQEAFEVLWKRRSDVEADKSKSFLFTVAYNRTMDVFRNQKKKQQIPTTQEHTSSNWEFDQKNMIMQALEKIPAQQKSAILLKDWEGYSYQEIADILNISLAQVKVSIHRGRKTLRDELKFLKS